MTDESPLPTPALRSVVDGASSPENHTIAAARLLQPFLESLGEAPVADPHFALIGDRLEDQWRAAGYREDAFSEIATSVLTEWNVPADLSPQAMLAGACLRPLPAQEDRTARFGEPPITVYRGKGFYLAVIVWMNGSTAIHDHAFSGAFKVLGGSSIHCTFEFEPHVEVSRRLMAGSLEIRGAELLRRGDTRPIRPSTAGTHSLFHLERPSLTLVARSYSEPWAMPQLEYWRPGLAFDPFRPPPDTERRLQILKAMRAFDATGALALSTSMIEQTDPFDGFLILRNWILSEPSAKGILDHLGEVYSRRNPQLAPYVQPTIDSVARGLAIHQRRIRLTEPRHRLLLAILLNVPDWRSCTELIRAAFPEAEPAAVLATLFGELASPEWRNIADVSAGPAEIAALQTALRSAGPRTDLHALVEPLVQREPSP